MTKNPTQATDHSPHRPAESVLRKLVDELRCLNERPSIPSLIRLASKKGIRLRWRDLYPLHIRMDPGAGIIVPPYVTDFLSAYMATKRPNNALDPWAGAGSFLLPIVHQNRIPEATGISPQEGECETARLVEAGDAVRWLQKTPETGLDEVESVDFVVSSPPIGLPPVKVDFQTGAGTLEVRDSRTFTLALKAAAKLTADGHAVFILPNSFFFRGGEVTVRESLPRLGLYVNSVVALPPGAFSFTSIELNLVFISRTRTEDLFVGRLSQEGDWSTLLKNLSKRKAGQAIELGILLNAEEFKGWQALAAREEERRLAERSGLTRVPLAELVEEINLGRRSEDGDFKAIPNAVYLPLIGTSPAVTDLSDLRIKPQNCAQLVVRPEKAYAEFLAELLNSPLGRKTRDGLLRGSFIPKISKTSLLEAKVYTLPLEKQKDAVDANREIRELQLQLEGIERGLWSRPVDARKVRKALQTLNQKESLEGWLETLPFPLASILWRYQATSNAEHKSIHLLNFFEAAAQFFGTLMASAFHSNTRFFQESKKDWFDTGSDKHSLTRSSFGDWVVRCKRLAHSTRQLLSDQEKREFCLDLFKTDSDKIEIIANKSLYPVLEKVAGYRNNWKHGGITGCKEHERRVTLLEEGLTRLRSILSGVFEDWWIIRPGTNEYTAGIYHYRVEKIMGSRQIFKQVPVMTSVPMDRQDLYFFDPTTNQPLQILPFFRMMPAPESEEIACYFYNRVEKSGVRWISYHFEGTPDSVVPDVSLMKLIREVENGESEA